MCEGEGGRNRCLPSDEMLGEDCGGLGTLIFLSKKLQNIIHIQEST